jgi:hypothetical protein
MINMVRMYKRERKKKKKKKKKVIRYDVSWKMKSADNKL